MDIRLEGISTRDELRQHVIAHGCYSEQENRRIFDKWFVPAPRYVFRAVNKRYQLTSGTVCDVGCAYGANLPYCPPGSYGIDIEQYEADFAQSIGLTVYHRDVIHADFSDLPQVDVVWNSATLEHVESPHIFLRKLHQLLKPNGLLALNVPTIPPFPWLKHLPRLKPYFVGHLHSDHINAFTPATLRFFCERAGFATETVSPFLPRPLRFLNGFHIIDGIVYVGRKIADWEYPSNATRRAALNPQGFTFKGQDFGEPTSDPTPDA